MDEKQINKWLRRRFRPVGWTLIGYYALMNLMVYAAMVFDLVIGHMRAFALRDLGYLPDADALYGNAWGYLAAIAVVLVVLYAWKGPDYWGGEVLTREKPMTAGVFGCMLCLCIGTQMANSLWIGLLEVVLNAFGLSAMDMLEQVYGQSDTVSMFLYSALAAPIAEELIFRGFVLRSLRPYGKLFAVFVSALLFGLFHGNLLQTPYAFLMGLVLGYVTAEYSIGWAVGLHMFNNLVLADLLGRLMTALPEAAAYGLDLLIFGGCFAAGLAILISRRGQIRAYNQSEWMDRRCLECFFTNSGTIVFAALMLGSMLLMFLP